RLPGPYAGRVSPNDGRVPEGSRGRWEAALARLKPTQISTHWKGTHDSQQIVVGRRCGYPARIAPYRGVFVSRMRLPPANLRAPSVLFFLPLVLFVVRAVSFLLRVLLVADAPEVDKVIFRFQPDGDRFVWLPVAHLEAVRHNPRARLELLLQEGPKHHVQIIPHVEHHHRAFGEVLDLNYLPLAHPTLI